MKTPLIALVVTASLSAANAATPYILEIPFTTVENPAHWTHWEVTEYRIVNPADSGVHVVAFIIEGDGTPAVTTNLFPAWIPAQGGAIQFFEDGKSYPPEPWPDLNPFWDLPMVGNSHDNDFWQQQEEYGGTIPVGKTLQDLIADTFPHRYTWAEFHGLPVEQAIGYNASLERNDAHHYFLNYTIGGGFTNPGFAVAPGETLGGFYFAPTAVLSEFSIVGVTDPSAPVDPGSFQFFSGHAVVVPEPSTSVILIGGLAFAATVRRGRKDQIALPA